VAEAVHAPAASLSYPPRAGEAANRKTLTGGTRIEINVLIISRYLVNDSSEHIFRNGSRKVAFTISLPRSTVGTDSYPDST